MKYKFTVTLDFKGSVLSEEALKSIEISDCVGLGGDTGDSFGADKIIVEVSK
jgi:hypothetical protein